VRPSPRPARLEKLLRDGQAFLTRGQASSARNRLREAAKLAPHDARARFLLGGALLACGEADQARIELEAADALAPGAPEILANLGLARQQSGARDEAIETFRRALALSPGEPGIRLNLANALIDARRADEALALLAPAQGPAACALLLARAQALLELERPEEALAAAEEAARLEPDSNDTITARFTAMGRAGRYLEAIALAETIVARGDPLGNALTSVAAYRARMGDQAAAVAAIERAIARAGGEAAAPVQNLRFRAFRALYLDPENAARNGALHRAFGRAQEAVRPLPAPAVAAGPPRPPRIGFVSADFRRHSVASFLAGPLAALDRDRVGIFAYSNVEREDDVTARFRRSTHGWRDVHRRAPDAVARDIRADGIDVLFDLSGLTAGDRLDVFARKPAPVQITWLGYPYSTGLTRMDWRIGDPVSDPADMPRDDHTEKILRLRHFLCYAPLDPVAPPAPARPARREPAFGAFNNPEKYDDATLAQWRRVFARLPSARLVMRQYAFRFADVRDAWRARMAGIGLPPDRLDIAPYDEATPAASFAIHDDVDVCLDPLGYNGTTTTCQALWMGVPVIVVAGRAHAARVGASIMAAAGLPEFVARDADDAVEKIVSLAADGPRLAEYRRSLRDRVAANALCDAAGFARDFEAAIESVLRDPRARS
jgi:predicted O-linked N-acetylglucosamine transferase (SPINDLY family)